MAVIGQTGMPMWCDTPDQTFKTWSSWPDKITVIVGFEKQDHDYYYSINCAAQCCKCSPSLQTLVILLCVTVWLHICDYDVYDGTTVLAHATWQKYL